MAFNSDTGKQKVCDVVQRACALASFHQQADIVVLIMIFVSISIRNKMYRCWTSRYRYIRAGDCFSFCESVVFGRCLLLDWMEGEVEKSDLG